MSTTIVYESLATPLLPPASGPSQYLSLASLASLVEAHLDEPQLATRRALAVNGTPPSGRGSDRETVRVAR